ncbi:MAG: hypothetical protein ABI462_14955 [Ignavibacteria bacterium]
MSPGRLKVWNIQDLTSITFVTDWQPTGITTTIVHNVEIYGDYAVIAHYASGIRIVNITNPAVPVEVAWYDTRPADNVNNYNGCWGVYKFASGKIIGSDIANGLFVIKTTFSLSPERHINLKCIPEGMYSSISNQLSRRDTITVNLRDFNSPYAIVDSAKCVIDSITFSGLPEFQNASPGTYYIEVKHFNSIETWSKPAGFVFNPYSAMNYDFTSSGSQALGGNQTLVGSKYCIYTGDVNQDKTINLTDVLSVYNNSTSFVSGSYLPSDLNGDSIVNLADITLCFNNSIQFVSVIEP